VGVRDLTEADLSLLGQERGIKPTLIAKLRDRHHALARVLAAGMPDGTASAITGYSPSRISILKQDPSFRALMAHYAENEDAQLADFIERTTTLTLSAINELQDRLEEEPESFTHGQLQDLAKTFADRIGHAPVQRSVNVNANVDLGSRLAQARRRLDNVPAPQPRLTVIEGELVGTAES